jgi:hypothetical protein
VRAGEADLSPDAEPLAAPGRGQRRRVDGATRGELVAVFDAVFIGAALLLLGVPRRA